jgi:glucosamine-6-phosphate deaminase
MSHYVPHTRVPALVFGDSAAASRHVALQIDALVRQNIAAGRPTVLGLATGSTPLGLYRELIRLHRDAGLDLSGVVTFNLDEYYPMPPDDPHSYRRFMRQQLFDHVNVRPENIHIPDGTVPPERVEECCRRYEQLIRQHGGIDLQVLGIGRTGHVGFNEPGATRHSRTRLVPLDPITRRDSAGSFGGEANVPLRAVTMGVGTILEAKRVVLLAFGEHKAGVVARALEGEVTDTLPASFLQTHPDATAVLDRAAAAELTAFTRPWEVGPVEWTAERVRHAVTWLSLTVGKALLKLSDDDFREHRLGDLLREHGPASCLGQRVFVDRMATITNEPLGSGGRGTALVFSPHPDDDVISMGGTIIRLADQGHKVHVAYMTSGNIAVFDHDALRFTDFATAFNRLFALDRDCTGEVGTRVREFLASKRPGEPDCDEVRRIKQLIRETEARAAAAACGVPSDELSFMDLRFYRTGTAAKAPLGPDDIDDVQRLIERVRPDQVYVAGELSDPHGTHRVCAEAVYAAVRRARATGLCPPFEVWLYRGAWEEWSPHELDRVVPLSLYELERKRDAIFRHQSQKDRAMFPGGSDRREFWQRAEDRNRATARAYDALGLPEFYALEGFVRWRDSG